MDQHFVRFDLDENCDNTDKFAAYAPLAPLVLTHWGHPTHPELITYDPHKKGEKCNWGFASVQRHPIWLEVMAEVTAAIFQELQQQLDGSLNKTGYKPKTGNCRC